MRLPYENFIRFCITQGKKIETIQEMFEHRSPFKVPEEITLKEIYHDLLKEFREITNGNVTINSKPLANTSPEEVPTDSSPLLLPNSLDQHEVAEKLNVKEFWAVAVDDYSITKVPSEKLATYKSSFDIFEKETKPKRDICLLSLADYDISKIQMLIADKYDAEFSEKSLEVFLKYFWNVNKMSWSAMEKYVSSYIQSGNLGKNESRLLRWALDQELDKLAYRLGYNMKSVDELELVQEIVYGELIELNEHYRGDEEINAYERNKITSNMRQAVLFAKGYRDLLGIDSPEDIRDEMINPDAMDLEGYRADEDFDEEKLEHPDVEDIKDEEEEDDGVQE